MAVYGNTFSVHVLSHINNAFDNFSTHFLRQFCGNICLKCEFRLCSVCTLISPIIPIEWMKSQWIVMLLFIIDRNWRTTFYCFVEFSNFKSFWKKERNLLNEPSWWKLFFWTHIYQEIWTVSFHAKAELKASWLCRFGLLRRRDSEHKAFKRIT